MNSFLFALITVFGWGTWLAPSQKVTFPNQQVKTLYVVAANLGAATVVVVSALISIYWLREPPPKTRAARLTFIGCILATVGGIVLGNLK
ncbi:MAG: hypothetical protein WHX52_09215 [Anaerolineae bacterium]